MKSITWLLQPIADRAGHREPHNQTAFACTAPGAGQHRDYVSLEENT